MRRATLRPGTPPAHTRTTLFTHHRCIEPLIEVYKNAIIINNSFYFARSSTPQTLPCGNYPERFTSGGLHHSFECSHQLTSVEQLDSERRSSQFTVVLIKWGHILRHTHDLAGLPAGQFADHHPDREYDLQGDRGRHLCSDRPKA